MWLYPSIKVSYNDISFSRTQLLNDEMTTLTRLHNICLLRRKNRDKALLPSSKTHRIKSIWQITQPTPIKAWKELCKQIMIYSSECDETSIPKQSWLEFARGHCSDNISVTTPGIFLRMWEMKKRTDKYVTELVEKVTRIDIRLFEKSIDLLVIVMHCNNLGHYIRSRGVLEKTTK